MFVCAECGAAQPAAGRCPSDGTPLAPIGEDVLLGTTIGVYRVARLLGIGGMGRVYKGVHPAIGSRVAIKVLSRECSDRRDLVERFFAEAKAANLIRHEGIVNVLDLATLPDGRPYIIMEYLDGAPLASILEASLAHRAPLPLGGLARLVAEILDALGAAHAKGIIHRDLKPDNIYIAPSGRPKILDFGIAKLSDVGNTATRTGSLMGTPHYMSPEQAAGRTADHRADLYAIGVILFECATGRKPFVAEALFDLLRMQVEAPPPSPRSLRPDMPPELEQVILTALAKPPDQRFASAMAMSVALQQASAQLPPEQWQPLLPPSARPPSGISWAPTPPASWSGGSRPGPTPPPPMPQPLGLGHASTVPAGHLTHPDPQPMRPPTAMALSPQRSKTGWIILASAALIGGGITAAAVIANGKNTGPATSGSGSGSAAAAEAPANPTGKPDPWAANAAPTAPAAPTPPPPPPVDDNAKDDEDKDEDDKAEAAEAANDPLDQAFKQLDETISRLPPDQQKRLAAYKGLSKLPPAERMRRLQALARQGIPGFAGLGLPLPGAPGGPPPPPPPPGDGPPIEWITNHTLAPPPGFDPEHLDVSSFIPWAMTEARKAIPDAQLIRIDTNGVGPDGRANLKLPSLASDHGSIDIRFISPSRGRRDPKVPLGAARHDFKCMFRVMATPDGVEMMPIDFFDCAKERPVPPPRCSFSAIWKKAIARKAPSANAVGDVDYRTSGSRPVWYFAIGSGSDKLFSDTFGDDC